MHTLMSMNTGILIMAVFAFLCLITALYIYNIHRKETKNLLEEPKPQTQKELRAMQAEALNDAIYHCLRTQKNLNKIGNAFEPQIELLNKIRQQLIITRNMTVAQNKDKDINTNKTLNLNAYQLNYINYNNHEDYNPVHDYYKDYKDNQNALPPIKNQWDRFDKIDLNAIHKLYPLEPKDCEDNTHDPQNPSKQEIKETEYPTLQRNKDI